MLGIDVAVKVIDAGISDVDSLLKEARLMARQDPVACQTPDAFLDTEPAVSR